MGCGCGGGGAGQPAAGLKQYRVTFPDGRVQTYLHEGQAQREATRAGVEMVIIET